MTTPSRPVQLRPAGPDDAAFLAHLLGLAATWRRPADPAATATVLADPALAHYVADWPRPDDAGVIAEDADGEPVGGAWYRCFAAARPGFGFVAPSTPELSIAVVPGRRGSGIGTMLLDGLIEVAVARGVRQLSLSVEPDNPARRLYLRTGFSPVPTTDPTTDDAVTMVLRLDR